MTAVATGATKPSVWKAFTQPAAWTMFFFGFSSGLPFLLVAGTLAYWLKDNGIELKNITVIAGAGMTYALKFLWAPLLDHTRLPLLARFGQRRSWLLLAQAGVVIGLLAMAVVTPAQLGLFVGFTLLVAFAGATQDIAVDAYRIEIAPPAAQGALVATYSLGYRIALILTGAAALILADHVPWATVYALMALTMLVPIAACLLAREPDVLRTRPASWRQWMRESVAEPFTDFFRRYGWQTALLILLFILLFKIPEQALVGGIMSPFYVDMGFSKTEIGTITKLYGVWIGIVGVFLGGIAVARWGVRRPLLAAIVLCASCNLPPRRPGRVDAGDLRGEPESRFPRHRRGGVPVVAGQSAAHRNPVRAAQLDGEPAGQGARFVRRWNRGSDRLRQLLHHRHAGGAAGDGVIPVSMAAFPRRGCGDHAGDREMKAAG